MRKVFQVCRERNIKLNPSKLQCGRRVKFVGMMIAAGRYAGETQDTVYISPDQRKIDTFLTSSLLRVRRSVRWCVAWLPS